MATQAVNVSKMQVGYKGAGKHWTKAEVEARQKASQKTQRKNVKLIRPSWLDTEGVKVWKKITKDMAGLEIFDDVDADLLAVYCDTVSKYRQCNAKIQEEGFMTVNKQNTEEVSAYVKAAQTYMRLMMTYSDKLGLNPQSRARLAKKIAEEESDPNADMFG